MTKSHVSAELLAAMGDLLAAVRDLPLDYLSSTTDLAAATRDEVADQMSDYILPRLVQLDAPLLTVVGGSTGAGKSTLVSSIVGEPVTESGVLRPTTRAPVLVHHPDDAEWFAPDRLLPDLERIGEDERSSVYGLRLVGTEAIPAGLAILDAPDVDSIDQTNRELATQLLSAADLWLFVTSAARYADQVPWDYLRRAADRAMSVAVVLDRTADDAVEEVRGHLARMMTSRGLSDSPLFTVAEGEVDDDGLLPDESVAQISDWLRDLAADPVARRMVVGRTLDGAVRHIVLRSHDVADAVDDQIEIADGLFAAVDKAYEQAADRIATQTADGSLMNGEVLARWQEFVAGGDLMKALDDPSAARTGSRATRSSEVMAAVEQAVKMLLIDAADLAAEDTGAHWATNPAGAAKIEAAVSIDRASSELRVRAERFVDEWRRHAVEKIRSQEQDDPARLTRMLNGITLAVVTEMLVHQQTERREGLPTVGRRLLGVVFGEDAATQLVADVHADLVELARQLIERDRKRFVEIASSPQRLREAQDAVRDAARAAEYARHADFVNGEISP